MQCRKPSHGKPHNMGFLYPEVIKYCQRVGPRDVL